MRLLHTKDMYMKVFPSDSIPEYAILSHTWGDEEVTLQDMDNQNYAAKKGFQKIRNCCERAAEDEYDWIWIDTCTIDKTSSAELSEAINSMFSWYRGSSVCYAFLEDIEEMRNPGTSRWFTRGWTLQELIAPNHVVLLNSKWQDIGTKLSLSDVISCTTGIPRRVLCGSSPLTSNVAQRMSWASTRVTTREEDMAYCLMGLFDVHMAPIYGEGLENAFLRLQEEILRRSSDQTLFLWTPSHEPYNQGLLATSPKSFCTHYNCFGWHTGLNSMPKNPFDPYATFRPIFYRRSTYAIDTVGADMTPEGDEDENGIDFVGTLGSQGLQISLLAVVADKEPYPARRIFCLDILCTAVDVRNPSSTQITHLALRLSSDRKVGFLNGFVPNRLGALRRQPCVSVESQYILDLQNVCLKREKISVSQIRTSGCGPGAASNFGFHGSETTYWIGSALIVDRDNHLTWLQDLLPAFFCKGGLVQIQHLCSLCPQQYTWICLAFGIREQKGGPWCHFRLDAISSLESYQYEEQVSARFNNRSQMKLKCGQWALASVQASTKNENEYSIRIGFKTGLHDTELWYMDD